jgi:ABC-type phosphate/phosphonate transport system substrate-binding protein
MALCQPPPRLRAVVLALGLAALAAASAGVASGQKAKLDVLRIGATATLMKEEAEKKKKSPLKSLRSFIRDETGLKNEFVRHKDWSELADALAKGKVNLGVFQGYEFAWAKAKRPQLKPLTIAVSVYRYPVAYVVTRKDNPAKKFDDLKGQSLSIPDTGQTYLNLFAEREAEARGKKLNEFFSKVESAEDAGAALDDVVDSTVKAAVVDRAALESFKRRKPGRFRQLKEVAKSKPFPPAVVVSYNSNLAKSTLERFRKGMLNAKNSERGETMLNLFGLSGFEDVPNDLERVLTQTRKTYPPEGPPKKE